MTMRSLLFCFILLCSAGPLSFAEPKDSIDIRTYNRAKTLLARFGDKEKQDLFAKALKIPENINKRMVGQQDLAAAFQIRLIQYLTTLGSRKAEPIALHIFGLPGVGKTSLMESLEEAGFPLVRIDAQKYASAENQDHTYSFMHNLRRALDLKKSPDKPLILFIDELDKVPEVKAIKGERTEVAQIVVSSLNDILSEGKVIDSTWSGQKMDFSNVLILTAMNISPMQINSISKELFGEEKSFWTFNEDDLAKFNDHMRSAESSRGAIAQFLSLSFRSNTISRLIPDVVPAKVLVANDFKEIVEMNLKEVVERVKGNRNLAIHLSGSDSYYEFLRKQAVFAPSGARVTVKQVDLLTEQLVTIAIYADLGSTESLSLPKNITITYDEIKKEALLKILILKRQGSKTVIADTKVLAVKYNPTIHSFEFPSDLVKPLPKKLAEAATVQAKIEKNRRATRSQIRKHRQALQDSAELEKYLNSVVYGQEELAHALAQDLTLYMTSNEAVVRKQTVLGTPGIGKTKMFTAAAEKLKIPLVKINMQHYSGQNHEAADQLANDLFERIEEAIRNSPKGKYILLIEEVDKLAEFNPIDGSPVARPAIAVIKDLLDIGQMDVTVKNQWQSMQKVLDIRGGFVGVDMNFPMDGFNLKADPRMTTIEDMFALHHKLSGSPQDLQDLLNRIFNPDTLSRLYSRSTIMANPLDHYGYEQILKAQVNEALLKLSATDKAKLNHGELSIKMTEAYLKGYLFSEAVIPSLGGREAAKSAEALILADVREALGHLSPQSPLFSAPLEIILDYLPQSQKKPPRVKASARLSLAADRRKRGGDLATHLYTKHRYLRFPSLKAFGSLDKIRSMVATHEFGHAYTAVMYGVNFGHAVAVSPYSSVLGYVTTKKYKLNDSRSLLANLMTDIGSLAMEIIMYNDDPLDQDAITRITDGTSDDIKQATAILWQMIHKLGMNPYGGVIERSGLGGNHQQDFDHRDYFFAELTDEKVTQLSLVIRDLVDAQVKRILAAHDRDWLNDHIIKFGQAGGVSKAEFYQLINYEISDEFRQGRRQLTAQQNLDEIHQVFLESLKKRLTTNACADALESKK